MWRFLSRDVLGFGFGLWLFGYLLGVVLFAVVPPAQIGWWVTPFGLAATLLTLSKWVHPESLRYGAALGFGWGAIAIAGASVIAGTGVTNSCCGVDSDGVPEAGV